MQRSWVQWLTGEPRSHMPHGVAKKIKEYMILSSKEWNTDICCNMDDPRKHGSTWRKPDTKDPMYSYAAAAAKSLQSCLTLCDPIDGRQPTRLCRPWDFPGKNTGVGCHFLLQCMKVKSEVAQSCLTLCDPMDCSLPGSSVHGIFQARVLEWGAIAFSDSFARAAVTK